MARKPRKSLNLSNQPSKVDPPTLPLTTVSSVTPDNNEPKKIERDNSPEKNDHDISNRSTGSPEQEIEKIAPKRHPRRSLAIKEHENDETNDQIDQNANLNQEVKSPESPKRHPRRSLLAKSEEVNPNLDNDLKNKKIEDLNLFKEVDKLSTDENEKKNVAIVKDENIQKSEEHIFDKNLADNRIVDEIESKGQELKNEIPSLDQKQDIQGNEKQFEGKEEENKKEDGEIDHDQNIEKESNGKKVEEKDEVKEGADNEKENDEKDKEDNEKQEENNEKEEEDNEKEKENNEKEEENDKTTDDEKLASQLHSSTLIDKHVEEDRFPVGDEVVEVKKQKQKPAKTALSKSVNFGKLNAQGDREKKVLDPRKSMSKIDKKIKNRNYIETLITKKESQKISTEKVKYLLNLIRDDIKDYKKQCEEYEDQIRDLEGKNSPDQFAILVLKYQYHEMMARINLYKYDLKLTRLHDLADYTPDVTDNEIRMGIKDKKQYKHSVDSHMIGMTDTITAAFENNPLIHDLN